MHSHDVATPSAASAAGGEARLTRFAWLSIAAALVTIALKVLAYRLTGSVGLLSDAAESGVNLVAAIVALVALTSPPGPPTRTTTTATARPSTSRPAPRAS